MALLSLPTIFYLRWLGGSQYSLGTHANLPWNGSMGLSRGLLESTESYRRETSPSAHYCYPNPFYSTYIPINSSPDLPLTNMPGARCRSLETGPPASSLRRSCHLWVMDCGCPTRMSTASSVHSASRVEWHREEACISSV